MDKTPKGSIVSTWTSLQGKEVGSRSSSKQPALRKRNLKGASSVGTKRGLSNSPSKTEGSSKSKKAKKVVVETDSDEVQEIVKRLDLGDITVDEDSMIDPSIVPAVDGKVRGFSES